MPNALIVEDDLEALEALTVMVEKQGFSTATAATWKDARTEIARQPYDVILLDVKLPGGSGLDLLLEIPKEKRPQVLLMSGDSSVGKAFQAMPMRELLFVRKPIEPRALEESLAVVRRKCRNEAAAIAAAPAKGLERLVGESAAIRRVRELVSKVAHLELSVYVEGESGTGKELVAQAIHELGPRKDKPFVALNCGALPANLIDSELFGHTKGSFTGATKDSAGVFQQASGGTLFLDEIAEMPVEIQVRLLRTLENGRVRPVGSDKEIAVDVRLISATNRRFEKAIGDGRFREDLFHRLCVFPIVTPALRDRGDDVELLAKRFLHELVASEGVAKSFADETLRKLREYDWPGNVRQLRNAVHRAYVMADEKIEPDCLPPMVLAASGTTLRAAAVEGNGEAIQVGVGTTIADAERRLIEATLKSSSGDKRAAAEILGVSLRTLYNRLKGYKEEESQA